MAEKDLPFARVVFCDSGLGGLDVAANFISLCRNNCRAKELEIICFNAWPRPGVGFNQLPDLKTKLKALQQVNEAIFKLSPSLVVYACNTISTLISDGNVALPFPALTMLDAATGLLANGLRQDPEASLLICGTATTAQSGIYSKGLYQRGFSRRKIAELGCPGLATQIEYAPNGAMVCQMLRHYARQAAEHFGGGKLLLGLCCTHFGYTDLWQSEFRRFFDTVTLLNPNTEVAKRLSSDWQGEYTPHITAKLLTRVEIAEKKRSSLAVFLVDRAPEIAEALYAPVRKKNLFTF